MKPDVRRIAVAIARGNAEAQRPASPPRRAHAAITAACHAVEPSVPAESVCAMLATLDPTAVTLSVNWARDSPSAALLLATASVPSCPTCAKALRRTAPSSDVNESDTKPPTGRDSNPTVTPAKSKRMSVVGVATTCEGCIDRTEMKRKVFDFIQLQA